MKNELMFRCITPTPTTEEWELARSLKFIFTDDPKLKENLTGLSVSDDTTCGIIYSEYFLPTKYNIPEDGYTGLECNEKYNECFTQIHGIILIAGNGHINNNIENIGLWLSSDFQTEYNEQYILGPAYLDSTIPVTLDHQSYDQSYGCLHLNYAQSSLLGPGEHRIDVYARKRLPSDQKTFKFAITVDQSAIPSDPGNYYIGYNDERSDLNKPNFGSILYTDEQPYFKIKNFVAYKEKSGSGANNAYIECNPLEMGNGFYTTAILTRLDNGNKWTDYLGTFSFATFKEEPAIFTEDDVGKTIEFKLAIDFAQLPRQYWHKELIPTHTITVGKLGEGQYGYSSGNTTSLKPDVININSKDVPILALVWSSANPRGVAFTDSEGLESYGKLYLVRLDKMIGVSSDNVFFSVSSNSPDFFTEDDVGKSIPLYFSQQAPSFDFTNISYEK